MAGNERGVLDVREMPATLDHHEARVRQALAPQRRVSCGAAMRALSRKRQWGTQCSTR